MMMKVSKSTVATVLIYLASIGLRVLCATFPSDMTVSQYSTAFFPCELPGKSLPVWVINSTQYYSIELLSDHRANLSGLLVYARPEYNNTSYQCRFINVSITELGLIDEEVLTSSPAAVLTIIKDGLLEDVHECSCKINFPTTARYNFTSKFLSLALNETVSVNDPVPFSYCNNGEVVQYLNQTCSAIDVILSPETNRDLVIIGIPPVCSSCDSHYLLYMAIQFSNNATVPSSSPPQYHFSGSCFVPTLNSNFPGLCSNPQIIFSANGITKVVGLGDDTKYFVAEPTMDSVNACFQNAEPFLEEFGDVKEVLIQEVCLINPYELCSNITFMGMNSGVFIYGSSGILNLDPNGADSQLYAVCSLKDNNDTALPESSSTASVSPQTSSSSQHLPTPTLSSSVTHSTESFPSSSPNPFPMTSPTASPTTERTSYLDVILAVGLFCLALLIAVAIALTIVWLYKRKKGEKDLGADEVRYTPNKPLKLYQAKAAKSLQNKYN